MTSKTKKVTAKPAAKNVKTTKPAKSLKGKAKDQDLARIAGIDLQQNNENNETSLENLEHRVEEVIENVETQVLEESQAILEVENPEVEQILPTEVAGNVTLEETEEVYEPNDDGFEQEIFESPVYIEAKDDLTEEDLIKQLAEEFPDVDVRAELAAPVVPIERPTKPSKVKVEKAPKIKVEKIAKASKEKSSIRKGVPVFYPSTTAAQFSKVENSKVVDHCTSFIVKGTIIPIESQLRQVRELQEKCEKENIPFVPKKYVHTNIAGTVVEDVEFIEDKAVAVDCFGYGIGQKEIPTGEHLIKCDWVELPNPAKPGTNVKVVRTLVI